MKKIKRFFTLLLIIAIALLIYRGNITLSLEEYPLSFRNLPSSFNGLSILQLSDLHHQEFGENNSELVSHVRSSAPDMIVLTGDMIENADLSQVESLLSGIADTVPIYYVAGNHEWASGALDKLLDLLNSYGVIVLQNEFVILEQNGEQIAIVGIDDPNGPYDQKQPAEVFEELYAAAPDIFTVVLYHRNDMIEEFSALGADLVISGHAHGGLIRLPFTDGLIAPGMEWFPTYTSGVYTYNDTSMVVSRGLGNTRSTFRILNHPHIPLITLQQEV